MPVPVKFKCSKCKGATNTEGMECISCSVKKIFADFGQKHLPFNPNENKK